VAAPGIARGLKERAAFRLAGATQTLWKEFSKRPGEKIRYQCRSLVASLRTQYQSLEILDTVSYGRALFLDDKIQSAESDEFMYHESLVHPAMLTHDRPERVFVAGGGEGAILREVLRHNTVRQVVMVDIDREAVALCKKHLAPWHQGAFDNPKVQLLHEDARKFLEDSREPFDVIIVDVTDPLAGGPSYRLFTQQFYQLVSQRLSSNGVIAVQAESADVNMMQGHLAIWWTLSSVFRYAAPYQVHVPSFGETWGFVMASQVRDPKELDWTEIDAKLERRDCTSLQFYDGLSHQRLFALPKYMRDLMPKQQRLITDENPLLIV
jgi:spermidine synthase